MDVIRERFRGCLLGGATGESLGTAGASAEDARSTLATAEGLLLGWDDSDELGSACLVESVRRTRERLAGGDGLAGVAPVGLFMWRPDGAFSIRPAFALATELGGASAGAVAAIVAALADGMSLQGALAIARHLLERHPDKEQALAALNRAESYARAGTAPEQAVGELAAKGGPGAALAIAAYCALVADSFAKGVSMAVKHGGGDPSTAAVAGQLLGALHGVKAIPGHWLERVEARDALAETADRLATYWRSS